MPGVRQQSNFFQPKAHDEQLERLDLLAERYLADDPNSCLLKFRQLAKGMAQSVAPPTQRETALSIPTFPTRVVRADGDDHAIAFTGLSG